MALVTLSPTINHSPLRPSRGSCLDRQPEPSESDERATQATRAIFNLRPSLVAAGAATIAIDVTLLVTLGSAPSQDKRQPARHSEPVAKRAPCPSPPFHVQRGPQDPFQLTPSDDGSAQSCVGALEVVATGTLWANPVMLALPLPLPQ
jgi:hypothetical protein